MSEASSLSSAELASLAAVLDTLIPPSDARALPGAGALGLAAPVAAEIGTAPEMTALIRTGLERVEAAAGEATRFAELDFEARQRLLQADNDADPIFVRMLIAPTYIQYYEEPAVLIALGLEARPPHPLGYALESGDPALLDPVRKRAKFFRDC